MFNSYAWSSRYQMPFDDVFCLNLMICKIQSRRVDLREKLVDESFFPQSNFLLHRLFLRILNLLFWHVINARGSKVAMFSLCINNTCLNVLCIINERVYCFSCQKETWCLAKTNIKFIQFSKFFFKQKPIAHVGNALRPSTPAFWTNFCPL